MRAGWNTTLEKRLRRADPAARMMVDAVVEVRDDVRKRRDQWIAADSNAGFEVLLDGRVRLSPTVVTAIGHSPGSGGTITDLDRTSPFQVAKIVWSGNASRDFELHRIKAHLDPDTGGGKNVDKWVCRVYRLSEIIDDTDLDLIPITTPLEVTAGPSAGEVTFDFSKNPPRPREDRPIGGDSAYPKPTTFVFIWAIQADGSAATNVAWREDSTLTTKTQNGHTLTQVRLTLLNSGLYLESIPGPPKLPYIILENGTYTVATITFSGAGNRLDLGAAPTKDVECVGHAAVPPATSVTFELNDDLTGVDAWHEFVDGDLIGVDNTAKGGKDLSTVTKQQEYLVRAKLTPNGAGDETPYLIALGVRELSTTALDELATVSSVTGYSVDPVELRGAIPRATITVIRDGALDYRDPMTDILAANDIGDITFRLWVGHPDLDRSKWLHLDDFLIDDIDQTGVPLVFECVSPLVLARGVLPKFDTGLGKRQPLTYTNQTRKVVHDDLLSVQLSVADRYIGPGVEDTSTLITKTIGERDRQSDGKRELDAVANLGGEGITSSQGRITVIDMHRDGSPVVTFPSDEIQVIGISPGYRSRIPEFNVRYDWLPTEQRFDKEIQRKHGPALTKLGRARIDPPVELDEEIARWIPNNQTLAGTVAQRVVDTVGAGLLLWAFRSIYPYPELELGDLIAIQTDRFVALDPHASRAIRGAQWAIGVVQEIRDPLGHDFTVWVRSYADIKSSLSTVTREGFGVPEVTEINLQVDEVGSVSVDVRTLRAGSIKLASSTAAFPSAATVRAAAANNTDADGLVELADITTLTAKQTLFVSVFAYELASAGGAESLVLAKAKITWEPIENAVPTVEITSTAEDATTETFTLTATAGPGGSSNLQVRSRTKTAGSDWGAFSAWFTSPKTGVTVTRHGRKDKWIQAVARDVDRGNIESVPLETPIQAVLDFVGDDGRLIRDRDWDDGDFAVRSDLDTGRRIESLVLESGGKAVNRMFAKGLAGDADNIDFVPDGTSFKRTTPNEKTGGGRAFGSFDADKKLKADVETAGDFYIPNTSVPKIGTPASPNTITKKIKIAYPQLVADSDSVKWVIAISYVNPGTLAVFEKYFGAVIIPPGVTITRVEAHFYRLDGNSDAELRFYRIIDNGGNTLLSTLVHNGSGWQDQAGTISEAVDDTRGYVIEVRLKADTTLSNARFQYAQIDYTIPSYDKGL